MTPAESSVNEATAPPLSLDMPPIAQRLRQFGRRLRRIADRLHHRRQPRH